MNFKKVKVMLVATAMMVTTIGSTSVFACKTPSAVEQGCKETSNNINDGLGKHSGETLVQTELVRGKYTLTIPTSITICNNADVYSADAQITVKSDDKYPVAISDNVEVFASSDTNWKMLKREQLRWDGYTVSNDYCKGTPDTNGLEFTITEKGQSDCIKDKALVFSADKNDKADLYTKGDTKEITTSLTEAGKKNKKNPWYNEGDYTSIVKFNAKLVRRDTKDTSAYGAADIINDECTTTNGDKAGCKGKIVDNNKVCAEKLNEQDYFNKRKTK